MIVTQDNKRDYFRMLINASCDVVVSLMAISNMK